MTRFFRWQRAALLVLPLLLCLAFLPGEALAKKKADNKPLHTVNYYQSHVEQRADAVIQVLELGISHGPVIFYQKESNKPNQLVVVLANTVPGEEILKRIPLDGRFASKLEIRKRKKTTELILTLNKPLAESHYRLESVAPDRKSGKPYRLLLQLSDSAFDDDLVLGLKGRNIVVDPGHGGTDSGAHGPRGSLEKDITLKVAERVKRILINSGSRVVLTREEDVDVWGPTATDAQELQARVDVGAYNPKTDVFVSIHCNAFGDPRANGTETYYYEKTWLDELLAKNLQARLVARGGLRDRGIDTARFYVCRHSAMPAALVELAFISNYDEELLLSDEDFQQEMAMAICEGLANYFAVLPAKSGRR